MFDARLRPLIDPPLNRLGGFLARAGLTANQLTLAGVIAGVAAAAAIAAGVFLLALALIAVSRLLDGLDGAVARATAPTDLGGYFDILGDFVFYVSVPLAFAFADPANAPAAAALIASFTLTGVSFLAFAVLAAKRNLDTAAHGRKSFFYSTGLAEGFETIAVFSAMCLLPAYFAPIALTYAALCLITVLQRTFSAARSFSGAAPRSPPNSEA